MTDRTSRLLSSLWPVLAASSITMIHVRADPIPFVSNLVSDAITSPIFSLIADMNHDGRLDIVTTTSGGKIAWWQSDELTPPSFTEHVINLAGGSFAPLAVTDLDHDGDLDVVALDAQGSGMQWFENTDDVGGIFVRQTVQVNPAQLPNGSQLVAADLDWDGDTDLVLGNGVTGQEKVFWYENLGTSPPTFAARIANDLSDLVPQAALSSIFVGDLDHDGDFDIMFCTSGSSEQVGWLESDGASPPAFARHMLPVTPAPPGTALNWHKVHSADMDGDGDLDVVAGSPGSPPTLLGLIRWWENSGTMPIVWTERTITNEIGHGPEHISCCDLDRDGDIDVLAATGLGNLVVWFDNGGQSPPTFVPREVFNTVMTPVLAICADFGRDGDLDVLVGTATDGSVRILRNVQCPADIDGDGLVAFSDINEVLANWLKSCQ